MLADISIFLTDKFVTVKLMEKIFQRKYYKIYSNVKGSYTEKMDNVSKIYYKNVFSMKMRFDYELAC